MEKLLRENVMFRQPIRVMPQFPINLKISIKRPREQQIPLFTRVLTLCFLFTASAKAVN